MRKRIFLITIILITSIALSFGIGFGIWTIASQNHGSSEGDIEGYTIIDLDKISDSTPAFYYNEAGFYDEETEQYSYNTTFTITIKATQKDEPYDLVISLISEDNFLSSATMTSSSDRNNEEGTDTIRIEQINENTNFDITYTITSSESSYSSLVSCLNENKKVFLHITAETADGAWSVDKEISLDANVQSLVEVNIPTPHLDSFTYNGQEQYCVENNPTYYELTNNTRINAGTQTVTASLKPGYKWNDNTTTNKDIEFTIKKLSLYIDYVQEIPSDSTVYTWDSFKSKIIPEFRTLSDNTIYDLSKNDYAIQGINDGEFYYGTAISGLTQYANGVVGSTYEVNVNVTNNYFLDHSNFYLKYKTVLIGSDYYTIEDALRIGGDLITDYCSATNPIVTKFSLLELQTYKINDLDWYTYNLNSESNLYVSYDKTTSAKNYGNGSNKVYSILYIPSNVVINCYGSISVAGKYEKNTHSLHDRGVIFNNGLINLISGKINSYGYIMGNGLIDSNNSVITDLMRIYDWPGGTIGKALHENKIFPIHNYSFHNISCKMKISYNSIYQLQYNINVSSVEDPDSQVKLLGSGGLFKLSSGYVIKDVEDTTDSYFLNKGIFNLANAQKSNQIISQREKIDIYGTFVDGAVTMSLAGVSISTGVNYAMPIGFINISLKDDGNGNKGNGTLSSNSYKFFPGSVLNIESGCSLVINNNVKIIAYDESYIENIKYDDKKAGKVTQPHASSYEVAHSAWYNSSRADKGAQIVINGSLTCNGYFGGLIQTNSNSARLEISHSSATLPKIVTEVYDVTSLFGFEIPNGSATVKDDENYCRGFLLKNNSIDSFASQIAPSVYYSYKDSNNRYGWYTTTGHLTYDTTGGYLSPLPDKQISITQEGYTITSDDTSYIPTRDYYIFDDWYLDESFEILAKNSIIYTGVTLYAKWIPIKYTITYNLYDGINDNNNPSTYDYESSFSFLNPTKENNVFLGWFLTNTWDEQITEIKPGSHGDIELFARWISEDEDVFVVNYHSYDYNNDNDFPDFVDQKTSTSDFIIRKYDSKNSNTSYSKYFDGWYKEENYINKVDNISQDLFNNSNEIDLYAKWLDKSSVIVSYLIISNTWYVYATQSKDLPDVTNSPYNIQIKEGHDFVWTVSGGKQDGKQIANGSNGVIFSDSWGETITVVGSEEIRKFTITITSGSNGSIDKTSVSDVPYGTTITESSNKLTIQGTTITATANSGYEFDKWNNIPDDKTIKSNLTITAVFKQKSSGGGCLLPNTLVAMADGTFKEIQYIVPGEMVKVFNHETGMLDVAPVIFNESEEEQFINVIHLLFDNGSNIGVIYEHGFFDLDTMRYEYIDETNYQNFIGHRFYTMDGTSTTLIDAYIQEEYTMFYSFPTYYHLNFFTDDILSMPGGIKGLFNIFEYGDNLQYDQDKMIEDINTYGLFTVEEFAQYEVTEEMFYAYGGQYLKVALGKGILTEEYLMYLIERYGKYTE